MQARTAKQFNKNKEASWRAITAELGPFCSFAACRKALCLDTEGWNRKPRCKAANNCAAGIRAAGR